MDKTNKPHKSNLFQHGFQSNVKQKKNKKDNITNNNTHSIAQQTNNNNENKNNTIQKIPASTPYSSLHFDNFLDLLDKVDIKKISKKNWKVSFGKAILKSSFNQKPDQSKPELYFNKCEILLFLYYAQVNNNFIWFTNTSSRSVLDSLKLFLRNTYIRANRDSSAKIRNLSDLIYLSCSEFKADQFKKFKETPTFAVYSDVRQFNCIHYLDSLSSKSIQEIIKNSSESQDEATAINTDCLGLYNGLQTSLPSQLSSTLSPNPIRNNHNNKTENDTQSTPINKNRVRFNDNNNFSMNLPPALGSNNNLGVTALTKPRNIQSSIDHVLNATAPKNNNFSLNIQPTIPNLPNLSTNLDNIFSMDKAVNSIMDLLKNEDPYQMLIDDNENNFNNFILSLKTEADKMDNINSYNSQINISTILTAIIANIVIFNFDINSPPNKHGTIKAYIKYIGNLNDLQFNRLYPKMLITVTKNLLKTGIIDKYRNILNLNKYITTLSNRLIPYGLIQNNSPNQNTNTSSNNPNNSQPPLKRRRLNSTAQNRQRTQITRNSAQNTPQNTTTTHRTPQNTTTTHRTQQSVTYPQRSITYPQISNAQTTATQNNLASNNINPNNNPHSITAADLATLRTEITREFQLKFDENKRIQDSRNYANKPKFDYNNDDPNTIECLESVNTNKITGFIIDKQKKQDPIVVMVDQVVAKQKNKTITKLNTLLNTQYTPSGTRITNNDVLTELES